MGLAIDSNRQRLTVASIAIAATVTILFELTSTRILSFIFWNHLVYLTITVALLGFGISGTLLAMSKQSNLPDVEALIAKLWLGLSISLVLTLFITSSTIQILASAPSWVKLAICYLVYVIPFVFTGAIISLILANASGLRVGKLYAADLAASGAACLGFYGILTALGAQVLVFVLALVSATMASLWLPKESRRPIHAINWGIIITTTTLAGVAIYSPRFLDFTPESYKELGGALNKSSNTKIEDTIWTPIARIDVVGRNDGKSVLPYYPNHPEGSFKVIMQDGSAHTRLLSRRAITHLEQEVKAGREAHGSNLPYMIKQAPKVGIIGVGGGIDVASALAYGARSVTGLELNPATAYFAQSKYRAYTGGLLDDPRVKFVSTEGRTFLRQNDEHFDLLQIIAIDTFAALSSGAYVLSENYLYTVEAFRDFYQRLAPDGVLSFYRFLFTPPRETLRLTTVAARAWQQENGTDISKSFFVASSANEKWGLAMFKKGTFTTGEIATLMSDARRRDMHVLYFPKILPAADQEAFEREYYRQEPEKVRELSRHFNDAVLAFANDKEADFLASYIHNVVPTTDDSPFFFEYNRLNSFGFPSLNKLRGDGVSTTLLTILIEAVVLSIFAIFGPLVVFRRSGLKVPDSGAFVAYFAAIGFGFMLVEIALIQKSVLFLGDPMHALTVILATILVGAGFGSFLEGRIAGNTHRFVAIGGVILVALLILMSIGLTPLFRELIAMPFASRVFVLVALLLLPSIVMGFFMPAGLQALRNERQTFVPWAWGINGCSSVFGSVAAILIALVYGFSTVLWVGSLCYIAAATLALLLFRKRAAVAIASTGTVIVSR